MRRLGSTALAVLLTCSCGGGDGGGDPDASPREDGGAVGPDTGMSSGDGGPDIDASPGDASPGDGGVARDGSSTVPVAPVAHPSSLTVEVGGTATGQLLASDDDGDSLTYSVVDGPALGAVTDLDSVAGTYTYGTSALESGSDSFTFQVNDGTSDADAPGLVSVSIVPFDFTGHYDLSGAELNSASCSPVSFDIQHIGDTLVVSQRRFRCGSTTVTFRGFSMRVAGGDLYIDEDLVGTITDNAISVSLSAWVSGCGRVRAFFDLARTATGFDYSDRASAACASSQVGTGTVAYTPTAYLVMETEEASSRSVFVDESVEWSLTVENLGKADATVIGAVASSEPLSYAGGTYPGADGTCEDTLAPGSTCTLHVAARSASPGSFSRSVGLRYENGATTSAVYFPLSVLVTPVLSNPTDFYFDGTRACVLDDGGLTCWGGDSSGLTPVPSLSNPSRFAVGREHACAIDDTGVVCWGTGPLGPRTVPPLSNPTAITAGTFHSCALDDTGAVCWGGDGFGQASPPALSNPMEIAAGHLHTCALDDTGAVCWGSDASGQSSPRALTRPRALAVASDVSCAIDDSGAVCWGSDAQGKATPPALRNPSAVAPGSVHSCALHDAGLQCWGRDRPSGVEAPTLLAPTRVRVYGNQTCVLDGGRLLCW